jgi:hypothetical protein
MARYLGEPQGPNVDIVQGDAHCLPMARLDSAPTPTVVLSVYLQSPPPPPRRRVFAGQIDRTRDYIRRKQAVMRCYSCCYAGPVLEYMLVCIVACLD